MPYSMILVAGSKGELVEVEQVDLFTHRINEMEFNISVHTDPVTAGSNSKRPLAVSLYETGCRLAGLKLGDDAEVAGARVEALGIRLHALSTVQGLEAEIGSSRLSTLLDNSLLQQTHFNP
ncbi:hypothetical protein H8F21_13325 [Pseudomonas sp. P66]|uniref:Uncharacterized protein n=1 Tax=Pseudomonas arcuscaelestis TaxID=2710591 RepID=A0ABS2BY69_9PSED|nr:hypothetical protein [Pseudomonas arcuscaelestis]MBM5458544.1 hypothetical protein [Pseudomonas arcuscaelestis]